MVGAKEERGKSEARKEEKQRRAKPYPLLHVKEEEKVVMQGPPSEGAPSKCNAFLSSFSKEMEEEEEVEEGSSIIVLLVQQQCCLLAEQTHHPTSPNPPSDVPQTFPAH